MIISLFLFIHHFNPTYAGFPLAVWEDPNTGDYSVVTLNGTNGVLTSQTVVPGMSVFVLGNKTCFNSDQGYYHFAGFNGGQQRYYTYDMISKSIVADISFSDNIVGIRYNCNDSLYYGLREQSNTYDLVTFDPVIGTVTSIGPVPGIDAYVGNAFALDRINARYILVALDAGNYYLQVYDIYSGALLFNNPFPDNLTGLRFNCVDTTVYALWEKGTAYQLEVIAVATGTHFTKSVLAGVVPGMIPESSSVNNNGEYTYRGFNSGNVISLITIDLASGMVTNSVATSDNAVGFEEQVCCYGQGPPVSVGEPGEESDIVIYPNPFSESLTVLSTPRLEGAFIAIRDMTGRVVRTVSNALAGKVVVDTRGLRAGAYALEVRDSSNGLVYRKVVLRAE